MPDIITAFEVLNRTPVPTILVVAGVVFVFIAVVGQFVGQIYIPRQNRKWIAVIGVLFLLSGISMYVGPTIKEANELSLRATQTAEAKLVVVNSEKPPTDTPTPTKTPRPTPTPTATIDADPTVYDNFNNPANNEGWNIGLWEPNDASACKIAQEEGFLKFSCIDPSKSPSFNARQNISFSEASFIEAKLMLDRQIETSNGTVTIGFESTNYKVRWGIACGIWGKNQDDVANTFCWIYPPEKLIEGPSVNYNTWHTLRIEAHPESSKLNISVDGQEFGDYQTPDADMLKAKFNLGLVTNFALGDGTLVTGYFDDVRIGQIEQ